jgi:tetratricopeptide (TPR) repeat protein
MEMDGRSSFAFRTIGQSTLALGNADEGIAALERAVEYSHGGSVFASALGLAYGSIGEKEKALQVLHKLESRPAGTYLSSFDLAMIHLGLGDIDRTLELLENAYEQRSGFIPFLNVEPMVDTLRDHVAFKELLRRIGFEPNS